MKKLNLVLAAFAASALLAVPLSTSAHEDPSQPEHNMLEAKKIEGQQNQEKKRAAFQQRRQAAAAAENKQDEAKKKACENRTESFKKRMNGIADRSERRMEVFNKIAERVQAFAKEKNVTVSNYDELVADVELKRTALEQAHDLAKENAGLFQCDGDNAKTNVAIFKQTIQDEHQAFKDYRESIKNLIKAVKQAISDSKPGESNE